MLTAILLAALGQSAELVWSEPREAADIIAAIKGGFGDGGDGDLIMQAWPMIRAADTELSATLRPGPRYYVFSVKTLQPVGKLNSVSHTLEIWAQPGRTVFRARASVSYGRELRCQLLARIKERIVLGVLYAALRKERELIGGL